MLCQQRADYEALRLVASAYICGCYKHWKAGATVHLLCAILPALLLTGQSTPASGQQDDVLSPTCLNQSHDVIRSCTLASAAPSQAQPWS